VTDQETQPNGDRSPVPGPPASSGQSTPDPWTIWLSRLIQVFGLVGFLHELIIGTVKERPYILLVCVAMMMGGAGLQLILRWALSRLP
jgi:hypothetical protein